MTRSWKEGATELRRRAWVRRVRRGGGESEEVERGGGGE